jgi:hypothetical protein
MEKFVDLSVNPLNTIPLFFWGERPVIEQLFAEKPQGGYLFAQRFYYWSMHL